MRVLCLVTLPTLGAGNRVRIEQYVEPLRRLSVDLDVSPFFDDATYGVLYRPGHVLAKARGVLKGIGRRIRDLWRARRYDVVLIYRESAPLGPPLFERALGRLDIPYVFDFDDAIFLGPVHPANRRWAWLRRPSRAEESARRASLVIAGNPNLAEWAQRLNPRVIVIPSSIDTDLHQPRDRGPRDRLVIGWVGSSTTAPYLRMLDEPLEQIAERSDVVMRVIGGEYAHPRFAVETVAYRLEEEPAEVAAFDVGVLPEPDDAWTRGKGAFKALLYMAAAVPVVASRVGVNEAVVGDAGLCVDSPAEWTAALARLLDDADLRAQLGARGRRRVEAHYSVRVQAPRLAQALRDASTSRGPLDSPVM